MRRSVVSVDHGVWLARIGLNASARMYTIGNPLIARTMLEHDIAAGLAKRASTEDNEESEAFSGEGLLGTCLVRVAERARAIQKETSLPSFPSV